MHYLWKALEGEAVMHVFLLPLYGIQEQPHEVGLPRGERENAAGSTNGKVLTCHRSSVVCKLDVNGSRATAIQSSA